MEQGTQPAIAAAALEAHPNNGGIDFENLPNTRDLGGMIAADGKRIKPRCLLRSGALAQATDADLARLRDEFDLRLDIDLRTNDECAERPDPVHALPAMRYVHLPVFEDFEGAGVSRSAADMEALRGALQRGEIEPSELMIGLYPHIVLDAMGIGAYTRFFEELLALEGGAALWHCSAGKDRCGMASVFIEVALGVPWEVVEADYLATNRFYGVELTAAGPSDVLEGVDPRFLAAAVSAIDAEYGGVEAYLERALGVDADARATLRARYLA